ncbi:MAG: 5'/3'-nucleotidase SurE [Alphaproteobacteria bacterium]|nr:5'/3'-nucleotidase SurE [Alphaproteobacteria bacterium]
MKQSRILICNDDGINAEGIHVLERAALRLSEDVWVVAPAAEQSGRAHSFTAKGALVFNKIDNHHFTVNGTPTDCMLFACNVLFREHKPDLIFSGINHGSNLGFDVIYSGTTGAAIEGTLQGIKSFAFSLYGAKNGSAYWPAVEEMLPKIVEKTVGIEWPRRTFLNVNFPQRSALEIAGIRLTSLSSRKIGDDLHVIEQTDQSTTFQIGYLRRGKIEQESDTYAVQNGFISVTPVSIEMTDQPFLSSNPFVF